MERNRRITLENLQLTFVGERHVGKTSLLRSYQTGQFNSSQLSDDQQGGMATLIDDIYQDIPVGGILYPFTLRDTFLDSFDEYLTSERLFPLLCLNSTALVACYAVNNRASFAQMRKIVSLSSKFLQPGTPIIFVATKMDLRDATESNSCISTAEGRALSRQMNAIAFAECSALSGENLRQIFEEAAKLAVNWRFQTKEKKKRCAIS